MIVPRPLSESKTRRLTLEMTTLQARTSCELSEPSDGETKRLDGASA